MSQYSADVNMIRINDRESLYELLALSDGMSLMPISNKDYIEKKHLELCFLPISDERLKCQVGVIYKNKGSVGLQYMCYNEIK